MNPRLLTKSLLPLVCGLVPLLSSCMTSKVSDSGDIAGGSDEIDTRVAVTRTGHPVAGARIALLRASDSTGVPVALNATADDGSYPKFAVPDGYYAVVLRDSNGTSGKYVDSLHIVGHTVPKGRDTLLSLGSVRGVVRVGAGQSPATVTIGLLGTDIVANVKADGTFLVDLVPGSLYTLAAFPRLDGYGPLYKRIQLKDGQNLVLPDTLVMPYTGLPTPAGLRVLEDSVTGNVKLLWNRVDHPDLLGYVVEKVESGSVTASLYLTDTAWSDSLRGYWEGLPLLGPWPSRDVAYRVRSRSLSGAPDSRSLAATFTAVAPGWTKHVDSVKVVMVTDSATGVTKLTWNSPVHPDLKGWKLTRKVNGTDDCVREVAQGEWNDGGCPVVGYHVVDSARMEDGYVHLLREANTVVNYQLSALRILPIFGESKIWETSSSTPRLQPWIEWSDSSISGVSVNAYLQSFGGWIAISEWGKNSRVSKDGSNWEEIPDASVGDSHWSLSGAEDSLWMVSLEADSFHIQIANRLGQWKWERRRLLIPNGSSGIQSMGVENGLPVIVSKDRGAASVAHSMVIDGDSIRPAHHMGIGSESLFDWQIFDPIDLVLRLDYQAGAFSSRMTLIGGETLLWTKIWNWEAGTGYLPQPGGANRSGFIQSY